uniref:Glycosyltransferase family 92 protein n=1 Tax=Caenorhabditis japonica TaxID=281687 RepID=A0A8R1DHQ6_CAEJA
MHQFSICSDNGTYVLEPHFTCGEHSLFQKFFRRHCVTAKILPKYSADLFIDADIGVVNPKRRIEEFLTESIEVTFYDRHFNFEIMAGSYLARNTPYAIDLIREFGQYEFKLPSSFHGTDNGAIHMFLAEKLFLKSSIEIEFCRKAYANSLNYDDLATYTACLRNLFGANTDFGKIRIMRKLEGWARDDWLTSGVWSPELDFMLHGWKTDHLKVPPRGTIRATTMNMNEWYSPFAGPIVLDRCTPGNTTWSYNEQLVGTREAVWKGLKENEKIVAFNRIKQMGKIHGLMERKSG